MIMKRINKSIYILFALVVLLSGCEKFDGSLNVDPNRPTKGISGADPFVIAMAKSGGAHWTVVADEHQGSLQNRKIPFVCAAEQVRCINFQRMMLEEGWQFR